MSDIAEAVLLVLAGIGFALVVAMRLALIAATRKGAPPAPLRWPAMSVLKPLKGLDPGLEANLVSFFAIDYPAYEVVLGAEDADDPALAVARRVAARFPRVPSRVVAGAPAVYANPKVNVLASLARRARHTIYVVSDSNVAVGRSYLKDAAAHLTEPGTGLVTSLIRAGGERGLGGAIERLHLNTFVAGGVAAVSRLLARPCVVGKPMVFRRRDLERIGGFERLGGYLAEDQVCGEEMAARGRRVAVTSHAVDHRLGRRGVLDFARRQARWNAIRRRISPPGYAGEILLHPILFSLLAAAAGAAPLGLGLALAAWLARAALDAAAERALGVRRPLASYLPLALACEGLVALIWFAPFVRPTVTWRGNRFRIGPRTALPPVVTTVSDTAVTGAAVEVVLQDDARGHHVDALPALRV